MNRKLISLILLVCAFFCATLLHGNPFNEEDWQFITTATGKTTGHIGNLIVTNKTNKTNTIWLGSYVIPSENNRQGYAVFKEDAEQIEIQAGKAYVHKLYGYCINVNRKPASKKEALPHYLKWVSAKNFDTNFAERWSQAEEKKENLNFDSQLAQAAPIILEAVQKLETQYYDWKSPLQIPDLYPGNANAVKEAIIQQAVWQFTEALQGKLYSFKQFEESILKQEPVKNWLRLNSSKSSTGIEKTLTNEVYFNYQCQKLWSIISELNFYVNPGSRKLLSKWESNFGEIDGKNIEFDQLWESVALTGEQYKAEKTKAITPTRGKEVSEGKKIWPFVAGGVGAVGIITTAILLSGGGDDNIGKINGCTDKLACNYNEEANTNDGSCKFDDCLGVCGGATNEDCYGICNGNAIEDECGICEGPGPQTWYKDEDGDSLGNPAISQESCTQPFGFVDNNNDDCDGKPDCKNICNGNAIEDECGVCDGMGATTWYEDEDGDGLGNPEVSLFACIKPPGFVDNNGDNCEGELDCKNKCNGDAKEDECGLCDGPGSQTWYEDADGDGLGNPEESKKSCNQPPGYVANNNDDCDGEYDCKNKCNGNAKEDECGICDGPGRPTWYEDRDEDGLGNPDESKKSCDQPPGYVANNNDDCDGEYDCKNKCNGDAKEDECGICDGPGRPTWYEDRDEDGLGNPDESKKSCNQPPGYVANNNDDCDGEYDCKAVCNGNAKPGTSCNDGNSNTTGDVYNEDCKCKGFVTGCTDNDACNYNSNATVDDGYCVYEPCKPGCNLKEGTITFDDCGVYPSGNINPHYYLIQYENKTLDPKFDLVRDQDCGFRYYFHKGQEILFDYKEISNPDPNEFTCEEIDAIPVEITCLYKEPLECNFKTGTIFYEDCDSSCFILIELDNGLKIDPWPSLDCNFFDYIGIVEDECMWNLPEGQRVKVDFEIANFDAFDCDPNLNSVITTCIKTIDEINFKKMPEEAYTKNLMPFTESRILTVPIQNTEYPETTVVTNIIGINYYKPVTPTIFVNSQTAVGSVLSSNLYFLNNKTTVNASNPYFPIYYGLGLNNQQLTDFIANGNWQTDVIWNIGLTVPILKKLKLEAEMFKTFNVEDKPNYSIRLIYRQPKTKGDKGDKLDAKEKF